MHNIWIVGALICIISTIITYVLLWVCFKKQSEVMADQERLLKEMGVVEKELLEEIKNGIQGTQHLP